MQYTSEADVVYKHIMAIYKLWIKAGRRHDDFMSGLDQVQTDAIHQPEHKQ